MEYYFRLTDIIKKLDELVAACPSSFYTGIWAARNIFTKDLAVDVKPIVRAKWIQEKDRYNHWHCSECGYVVGVIRMDADFCPHCGAEMEADNG